jgi:hypothetical protein
MHMTASLESPSDVAALLRREMSVRWLAELGRAKVRHLSTSSSTSLWVLHWQQVAADYLAELAWHRLVEVPSEIAQQGVVLAIATNVEREKADSIE